MPGRYDELLHHNICVTKNYRPNLDEIERQHVLSADPLFVQNASVRDDRLAPVSPHVVYVLLPVSHEHPNIDWSRERDRYREVALRQDRSDRRRRAAPVRTDRDAG